MLAPVKSEPIVRPERSANCKLFEGIPPCWCVVKVASVLWCSHFIYDLDELRVDDICRVTRTPMTLCGEMQRRGWV